MNGRPLRDAAADILHHFAYGDAHGHFDQAAAVDLPGQREDLGPPAVLGAERGERAGAVADDPGHAGQRLDVVDDRRLPAKPALDGVRRPQPRHAALPFERLDQRGLLAAHECARALADLQAQPSEQAALLGLPDGRPHVAHRQRVLRANVQVALGGAYGVRRDGQPLQHPVRVGFQHQPVHERARIAFVAIADDILDGARLRAPERPFPSRGKTRAAAPAQPGFGNRGDHLVRRHRQRAIPIARQVVVDVQRVDGPAILQHDPVFWWGRRFRLPIMPSDDPPSHLRRHIPIRRHPPVRLHHFHQRLAIAHPVAANRLDGRARLHQRIAHRFAAAGHAARTQADPDLDGAALHAVTLSASHAVAGVSLPAVWPSTISTGARLQQPRQATSSSVNRRAASVSSPSGMAR